MSIWDWRGWILGVALGSLTNKSFVFTALSLILVLQFTEQMFVSKQRVVPFGFARWLENDNGIIGGALLCSLLLLAHNTLYGST